MKVLLSWHVTEAERDYFTSALPVGTELAWSEGPHFSRFETSHRYLAEHAATADVIVGFVLPDETLEMAENLKLLCWFHAGCDELPFEVLIEPRYPGHGFGRRECGTRGRTCHGDDLGSDQETAHETRDGAGWRGGLPAL